MFKNLVEPEEWLGITVGLLVLVGATVWGVGSAPTVVEVTATTAAASTPMPREVTGAPVTYEWENQTLKGYAEGEYKAGDKTSVAVTEDGQVEYGTTSPVVLGLYGAIIGLLCGAVLGAGVAGIGLSIRNRRARVRRARGWAWRNAKAHLQESAR